MISLPWWALLLIFVPALVLLAGMVVTIPNFSFHSIPDYARQGNRTARWYMRIVISALVLAVVNVIAVVAQR